MDPDKVMNIADLEGEPMSDYGNEPETYPWEYDRERRHLTTEGFLMEHWLTDEDAKTYLDIGVTPEELVRLRWPDMDADTAGFVLWELTPFPMRSGVHEIVDMIADVKLEVTDHG